MQKNSNFKEALIIIAQLLHGNTGEGPLQKSSTKLFVKEFLFILCVCVVFVMVSFFFYGYSIRSVDAQNRLDSYRMGLQSSSNTMDMMMSLSLESGYNTLKDSITLTRMSLFNEEPLFYGMTLTRAKADLQAIISGTGLFSQALYYIPSADILITSDGVSGSLATIPAEYRGIITDYMDDRAPFAEVPFGDTVIFYYYQSQDNLIFACNPYVYQGKPQAILFLLLNNGTLNSFLNEFCLKGFSKVSISIEDPMGRQIWQNQEVKDVAVIKETTNVLKWSFVLKIPEDALLPSTTKAVSISVFFAVLLVLVVAVVSLFLSAYLFVPLYHTTIALSDTGFHVGEIEDQQDSDSIVETITRISSYQKEISSTLKTISFDVQNKLFSDLLHGEPLSYSYVENTLQGMASGFVTSGLFATILVRVQKEDEEEYCLELLQGFSYKEACIFTLKYEEKTFAMVVQFADANISIPEAKAETLHINKALKELLEVNSLQSKIVSGAVFHSIMDTGFSFHEAYKKAENQNEDSSNFFEKNLSNKIQKLVEWYAKGATEAADSMKQSVVDMLSVDAFHIREWGIKTLEITTNEMATYPYVDPKAIPDAVSAFHSLLPNLSDEEVMKAFPEALDGLVAAFLSQMKLQHNPYILQARKYIADHLFERTLSQSVVAEALGITTSYLSRLFVTCLGVNYVEYVTNLRLEACLELLKNSNLQISEIADKCGFSSDRNFNYAFRNRFETSPGSWRKKYKETSL